MQAEVCDLCPVGIRSPREEELGMVESSLWCTLGRMEDRLRCRSPKDTMVVKPRWGVLPVVPAPS